MQAKGKTNSVSINGKMVEFKRVEVTHDLQKSFEQLTKALLPAVKAMEKAFIEFTVSIRIASADLLAALEATQEGEWWKNGGQPPLYKHSHKNPEWWQRGDEPPMFDSAA